ncbi:MAG TPA: aminoacyl-tRNA hydrolase [Corynebacterium stationis]|uniref:aminoacyl-tRNA hydrolase n=1 Tax=Corynebacterium stationis TaxID=1705 RepID=UPI001D4AD1F0|nr:aminoacyl-tRNA hydrolase [Corynebacterium stationis]HJG64839.1 aminoacyl-tRNA hydrolase [Corynebacterium stationis]
MSNDALLVVGLGNPGPKYERTRHNIGFEAAQELTLRHGGKFASHKRTNADVAEINIAGRKVIVAKPRTYMNLSGGVVKALANYFKISPANIVVIHDELDMELGEVRLRLGGGDHGHNGLRDTTKALGTKDYHRLSCGIGRPPGRMAPAAYVLKPFTRKELDELPIICADAADLIEEI